MRPTSVLIRLIRFSPGYFCALHSLRHRRLLLHSDPSRSGYQAFFNDVSAGHAGVNAWSAIAVLVALQIGEAIAGPLLGNPWSPLQQKSYVLLRRNLFAGILRGYGSHGLPLSGGEIVSRFRDDPQLIGDALDAACDLIGRSFFAVGAGVLMWRINPLITVTLIVPLLLCSYLTSSRQQDHGVRAASQGRHRRTYRFPRRPSWRSVGGQGRGCGAACDRASECSWATTGGAWRCGTPCSVRCSTR